MNRLDIYKVFAIAMLDIVALIFFVFAILTNTNWFFNCAFPIYLLLASIKYFISLHSIKMLEKTGEFSPELDLAGNMLQYVSLALVAFSVCIYCAVQIFHMVV